MKSAILLELAAKWEALAKVSLDANLCLPENHAPSLKDAEEDGRRQGLRECADGLKMLVRLLGD